MAYDIHIGHAQALVRVRRPWAVALLSILTLGVYSAGIGALEFLGAAAYLTAYALVHSRLNAVWQQVKDAPDLVAMDTRDWADSRPLDMVKGS